MFAGKFATGSSVSKNPQGEEEIVVQGDVGDDIVSVDLQRGFSLGADGIGICRWRC